MPPSSKHIIIIAGEASGDMHAAHLVLEIKKLRPEVTFSGLGGPAMQKAGVEIYEDLTKLAVVGFVEVLKHYPSIKRLFNLVLEKVAETNAVCVILVDYPGFNLRLARAIKSAARKGSSRQSVKVLYYISPQVWAWKENRVHFIRENVDRMLVLFSFEKDLYARYGMAVDFVGHPLLDMIKVNTSREDFLASHGLSGDQYTVGLLPGSRQKEVEKLLPAMLKAADILRKKNPRIQFLILKAPTIDTETITKIIDGARLAVPLHVKIIDHQTYNGIHASDICMVASGTATLETAILTKPMVVIYKTSFLTWLLARLFIKIPYIALVNVIAGQKIVPECLQYEATPKRIAMEMEAIFTNELRIVEIKTALGKVKESLGAPGASGRAAKVVGHVLD